LWLTAPGARQGSVTRVALVLDEVETYLDAMAERERVADTASLRSVLCPESLVVVGAGRRPVGFQKSVAHAEQQLYAARSYSLIKPPRTGRHLIRS
jgi:hypothetical protein